jgi:hypothetical protein
MSFIESVGKSPLDGDAGLVARTNRSHAIVSEQGGYIRSSVGWVLGQCYEDRRIGSKKRRDGAVLDGLPNISERLGICFLFFDLKTVE